jgi:hypothetical protein
MRGAILRSRVRLNGAAEIGCAATNYEMRSSNESELESAATICQDL